MYTLYRPFLKEAEEVSKNFNIAGGHSSLADSEDPLMRLTYIKATTLFLSKNSRQLPSLIKAFSDAIEANVIHPVIEANYETLDDVFRFTNIGYEDVDGNFVENPNITIKPQEGLVEADYFMYSTSQGDIITNGDKWWIVAANGFIEVDM